MSCYNDDSSMGQSKGSNHLALKIEEGLYEHFTIPFTLCQNCISLWDQEGPYKENNLDKKQKNKELEGAEYPRAQQINQIIVKSFEK